MTLVLAIPARPAFEFLGPLLDATRAAGAIALEAFRPGEKTTAAISWKEGNSPVTEADKAADALLRLRLEAAFPDAGWLSEETADNSARLSRRRVLIVDPIDGTRGFMNGDDRFAVCAALVEDGVPVAGVVHLPARGETYSAARGAGAFLNGAAITVSPRRRLAGARLSGPQPMLDIVRGAGALVEMVPRAPSLAYRIVSVADGQLDATLASARSHDWDLAAADLILQEAGGSLTDLGGTAPLYNRPEPRHGELLAAPVALREPLLASLRPARR